MNDNWYYSEDSTHRAGPVQADVLRRMIAEGSLPPDVLVWREGMEKWTAADDLDEFQAGAEAPPASRPAPDRSAGGEPQADLPGGLLGWMTFNGVFSILMGVLNLCNLFIGVFLIIAGIALFGARDALDRVQHIDPGLQPFFRKLHTVMLMVGLFMIASILFTLVVILLYAFFGVMIFSQASTMSAY